MVIVPTTEKSSPPPRTTISFREHLRDVLRLALWRTPHHPEARLSAAAMAAIFVLFGALAVGEEIFEADGALDRFSIYGVNALLAWFALAAAVIVAYSHFDKTRATARNLMFVYGLLSGVAILEAGVQHVLGGSQASLTAFAAMVVFYLLSLVWIGGAARAAFRGVPVVRRPALRAAAFVMSLILAAVILPDWPVFAPQDFDRNSANIWEIYRSRNYAAQKASREEEQVAQRKAEAQAARLEAAQHLVLAHAIGQLAERDPTQANVYTLGVAGNGYQDVFLKEIRQSTDILKSRFHLGERTLNLINNASTSKEAPMASMQNLGEALRAVSHRIDHDADLLILVLSSHGSPDGFALSYENLVERTLDPETLRMMLDASGIKNRVVIVSSCYSGTFVEPLKSPDTMILTAAASDRTSFGCADDRRWTWFGEAFFERGLVGEASLTDAFAAAKTTIAGWEHDQHLTASNPQIYVGEAIAKRFPEIVGKPPTTLGAAEAGASAPRSE